MGREVKSVYIDWRSVIRKRKRTNKTCLCLFSLWEKQTVFTDEVIHLVWLWYLFACSWTWVFCHNLYWHSIKSMRIIMKASLLGKIIKSSWWVRNQRSETIYWYSMSYFLWAFCFQFYEFRRRSDMISSYIDINIYIHTGSFTYYIMTWCL